MHIKMKLEPNFVKAPLNSVRYLAEASAFPTDVKGIKRILRWLNHLAEYLLNGNKRVGSIGIFWIVVETFLLCYDF